MNASAVIQSPSIWTQAPELARRSIMRTIRQPASIIPATVFPLILLAINSVGLKSATSLRGFPTNSWVTFALGFAFIQAGVFAVIGTGQNLAEDNQGGFFNRLQLTPIHPVALITGQLAGTLALGLFQAATYISVGLLAGAQIQAGFGGALVMIALAICICLAFGSVGLAVGMRSSTPESVQSLFPLIFAFLFMSSMSQLHDRGAPELADHRLGRRGAGPRLRLRPRHPWHRTHLRVARPQGEDGADVRPYFSVAEPGKGDELAKLLLEAADALADTDACRVYLVSRSPDAEEVVWVTEFWTNAAEHSASLESDSTRALIERASPLIAGSPDATELAPLGGKGL